jgi:hypothetical protein
MMDRVQERAKVEIKLLIEELKVSVANLVRSVSWSI